MIKSMTGFGRGEYSKGDKKFFVEIKSVNHRYSDFNIKITKKISFLEPQIKNMIKKYVARGKVDVYITYEDVSEQSTNIKINTVLIQDYLNNFNRISEKFSIENDVTVSFISKLPDVIKLEEQKLDEQLTWEILSKALKEALIHLLEMRKREGCLLKEDLMIKLQNLEDIIKKMEERSPNIVTEYKQKLEERLKELLDNKEFDDNRVAVEVAIFAERCSIDEELVRLFSHICQMRETLNSNKSVGRKLDFLAQEMNREANTIASKSNDLDITKYAIELKSEIEKIREQIQNVE